MSNTTNTLSFSAIAKMCGVKRTNFYYLVKRWPLPEPVFREASLTGYAPGAVRAWAESAAGGIYAQKVRAALTES